MEKYFLVFVLLSVLSYLYLKIADKFNIIDKPNYRSSHTVPVIRGGGVLFYFAVVLFFIINDFQYVFFFLGITTLAFISFWDDLKTLSPKFRLFFQFLAIALILIDTPLIDFGYLYIILLIIPGVAYINMYNFMDGINGITGIYSIVVFISLLLINNIYHFEYHQDLLIYTLISIAIFGYYNFRKSARFFAGDIGSISIAGIVLFLVIKALIVTESPLVVSLILVFVTDSVMTIIKRLRLKENISEPHRRHLYQVTVDKTNLSHLKIAALYGITQLIISLTAIFFMRYSFEIQWLVFFSIIVVLILLYVKFYKKYQ